MYPTSGAVIRGDINTVVEEAYAADTFFIGAAVMPPAKTINCGSSTCMSVAAPMAR